MNDKAKGNCTVEIEIKVIKVIEYSLKNSISLKNSG